MFQVGDRVMWESQAAGSLTVKTGKVAAIVPKDTAPNYFGFLKANGLLSHARMFDGWPRNHESYLIEVPGGKTPKAKPKLYWPRVRQLRKA